MDVRGIGQAMGPKESMHVDTKPLTRLRRNNTHYSEEEDRHLHDQNECQSLILTEFDSNLDNEAIDIGQRKKIKSFESKIEDEDRVKEEIDDHVVIEKMVKEEIDVLQRPDLIRTKNLGMKKNGHVLESRTSLNPPLKQRSIVTMFNALKHESIKSVSLEIFECQHENNGSISDHTAHLQAESISIQSSDHLDENIQVRPTQHVSCPSLSSSSEIKMSADSVENFGVSPIITEKINHWLPGEPVPYLALTSTLYDIQQTRSKLKHVEIMCIFFLSVLERTPDDLVPSIYMSLNQLTPSYEGIQLGIGEQILQKVIMNVTGKSMSTIKRDYQRLGDLGLIALNSTQQVRTLVKPKPLTIRFVYGQLLAIAFEEGSGTREKKIGIIQNLMLSARESEVLYIIKALQGKLRINLGPKSVLTALAYALAIYERFKSDQRAQKQALSVEDQEATDQNGDMVDVKNEDMVLSYAKMLEIMEHDRFVQAKLLLSTAYSQCPNWKIVIQRSLTYGLDALPETCKLEIGVPVEPMLALPTNGIQNIVARLKDHDIFTAEYKYDGERLQVHRFADGSIRIYSRNLENCTGSFPDLPVCLTDCLVDLENCQSFIIDCEAVAFDHSLSKILPYQVLSTRSRKDTNLDQITVQICLFVFDILHFNGASLIGESLEYRRKILCTHFKPVSNRFEFATAREFSDHEELDAFLNDAVNSQCEGLMIKTWNKDACYQPSHRSSSWLKFKKDYSEGLADSFDLIPIGAWFGKGKRTGFYGAFLLACYNDEEESYQSVCKIGTGFTDLDLTEFTKTLQATQLLEKPIHYATELKPDIWLDATTIWEVRAADLTLSPVHKAAIGLVSIDRGVGLRFPRFLKTRADKSPAQATTASQILDFYHNQKAIVLPPFSAHATPLSDED